MAFCWIRYKEFLDLCWVRYKEVLVLWWVRYTELLAFCWFKYIEFLTLCWVRYIEFLTLCWVRYISGIIIPVKQTHGLDHYTQPNPQMSRAQGLKSRLCFRHSFVISAILHRSCIQDSILHYNFP